MDIHLYQHFLQLVQVLVRLAFIFSRYSVETGADTLISLIEFSFPILILTILFYSCI